MYGPHLDKLRGMKSAAVAGDNFDASTRVREPERARRAAAHRVQRPAQRLHLARDRQGRRASDGHRAPPGAPGAGCRESRPWLTAAVRPSRTGLKSTAFRVESLRVLCVDRIGAVLEAGSVAQTEAHLPATSRRAAARKALLNPANLIPFPVLARARPRAPLPPRRRQPAVAAPRRDGLHADRARPPSRSRSRPARRTPGRACCSPRRSCSPVCACTSNGWGALLAVGFVFAAATAIHADGSRYALLGDGLHRAHRRGRRAHDRAGLGEDDGLRARGSRPRACSRWPARAR